MFLAKWIGAVALSLFAASSLARTNPGFSDGAPLCANVPNPKCPGQTTSLNSALTGKADYPATTGGVAVSGPAVSGNVPIATGSSSASWGSLPGAGSSTASQTASGQFNVNATSLLHWRAAIARVRAGLGRGTVVIFGASESMGGGAGSGGTAELNGAQSFSWPADLAAILGTSVPTSYNSLFCDNGATSNAGVAYGTYDTRVTPGANWSVNGASCMGGSMFKYTVGAANNFSFAPPKSFDTIKYWFFTATGNGTSTINVDGGASLGTINYGATNFVVTTNTYSVTAGTHTINIVPNNDASFQFLGLVTYLSTTPAIDIIDAANYGSQSGFYIANGPPWNPIPILNMMAPDLVIYGMTNNDCAVPTPIATFTANIQTVITTQQSHGDIILTSEVPQNNSFWTSGSCAAYVSALRSLAALNNIPFLDLSARWISYANINPVMPYGDFNHPGKSGYQDWALAVAEILINP